MKIILSGGGKREQTRELDSIFFNLVKENKVIFIPHSRKNEEFGSSFSWVKENLFLPFGHNSFEMWTNLDNKSIEDLKDAKGIILGGGNTFRLLKVLRDSNFIKVLKEFIEREGVVYGISAGAIILTKDIITAKPLDKNEVKLEDLSGMDVLEGKSIFCHYEKKYDGVIFDLVNNRDIEVIGLPEGTGIYINRNVKKIVGSNPAFFFSKKLGKKELKIGEEV